MSNPGIRLHASDNIVIARTQLVSGTRLPDEGVTLRSYGALNGSSV